MTFYGVREIYPIAHIFFALLLLSIFNSKNQIEISNKNKLFIAFLSVFPDIDFVIDLIYGTSYHTLQIIPIFISLVILSILYFSLEKHKKIIILCLTAVCSQFFGDLLVGAYSYRILAIRLHVFPESFYLFMYSFEIIMPIIFLVFTFLKKIAISEDKKIIYDSENGF